MKKLLAAALLVLACLLRSKPFAAPFLGRSKLLCCYCTRFRLCRHVLLAIILTRVALPNPRVWSWVRPSHLCFIHNFGSAFNSLFWLLLSPKDYTTAS